MHKCPFCFLPLRIRKNDDPKRLFCKSCHYVLYSDDFREEIVFTNFTLISYSNRKYTIPSIKNFPSIPMKLSPFHDKISFKKHEILNKINIYLMLR